MHSHHARLYRTASFETALQLEILKKASADVFIVTKDRFTIDDARELKYQSQLSAFEGKKRIFAVYAQEIALEAQNALLKLFEDPPESAEFHLVVRPDTFLLPTLQSRLHHVPLKNTKANSGETVFKDFLSLSYADRLARIASKTKEKDVQWIEQLLTGAEHHAACLQNKREFLQSLMLVRTYIRTKGASKKMLLEELSLILPASS